jgi:hypothetical protein
MDRMRAALVNLLVAASLEEAEAMQNLIDQYRRYPTVENAQRLRDYFERNPFRVWLLRGEVLPVLAAAGVRGLAR